MRVGFSLLLIGAAIVACDPSPAFAQTPLTLDTLPSQLDQGDVVSITPADREPLRAKVRRVGGTGLDLEVIQPRQGKGTGRNVTMNIAFEEIRSLERFPDSARNGAVIGAGIGAGFVGALFVGAAAVDRNEIGEWAPIYLAYGAAFAGLGALVGWAVDAASSKPHIRYDAPSATRLKIQVSPVTARGLGLAMGMSVDLTR